MWYATETAFVDGELLGSRIMFTPGSPDTDPVGKCFSNEKEPQNSETRLFGDRIEVHTDWFETEEAAQRFVDGEITYVHKYEIYKNMAPRFMSRKLVSVDPSEKHYAHRGEYVHETLAVRPWWACAYRDA